MKMHSILCILALVFTVSACSSGTTSNTGTVTQTDTTTTQTTVDTDDGINSDDVNQDSSSNDASDSDQSTDTNQATDSDQPAEDDQSADTGQPTNNEQSTDNDQPETPDQNDIDSNAVDNTSTPNENDVSTPNNDEPSANSTSPIATLADFMHILTGRTLIALNKSLSQGEMLSEQQENCLGSYEPAIGQPLLAIDCGERPLATGTVPIYATIASFKDSDDCRASLQENHSDGCDVDQALMTINTKWVDGDRRPQPKAGAIVSYNIEQNRVTIENLPAMLSGAFLCQYDIAMGVATANGSVGDCSDTVLTIANLIEEHLVDGQLNTSDE